MRTAITAGLLASAVLLAGCSMVGGDKGHPTETFSDPAFPLGHTAGWSTGRSAGNVTALGYQQPVPLVDAPTGTVWARLDVSVCQTAGPPTKVGAGSWRLMFEGNPETRATVPTGGPVPKPAFPLHSTLHTGDCLRGDILFAVPEGKRPTNVSYWSPRSEPRFWNLTTPSRTSE